MTIDLGAEELEVVLIALEERRQRLRGQGLAANREEDLLARLKAAERDLHRTPHPLPQAGAGVP